MKEKFTSVKAFVPIGAIAQVSITKNIAFLSGQVSIDPETQKVVEGTMAQQTQRVLDNIRNIVEEMGLGMDSVIKCNVFISSMEKFDEFNEVYQKYFDAKIIKCTRNNLIQVHLNAVKAKKFTIFAKVLSMKDGERKK